MGTSNIAAETCPSILIEPPLEICRRGDTSGGWGARNGSGQLSIRGPLSWKWSWKRSTDTGAGQDVNFEELQVALRRTPHVLDLSARGEVVDCTAPSLDRGPELRATQSLET